jgi:hypothetical protein
LVARNSATYAALVALGLVMLQFGAVRFSPWALAVRMIVPATIAATPLALWPYRARLGVWVMFVGFIANLCVIVANGGLMPFERSTLVKAVGYENADTFATGAWIRGSKDILVEDGGGRLPTLGDIIVVPIGQNGFVASPGDIVIWSGLLILAAEASIVWQRTQRRTRMERAQRIERAQHELPNEDEQPTAEGGATTRA